MLPGISRPDPYRDHPAVDAQAPSSPTPTTQLRARDHALSYAYHPAGATVVRVAIPELVRRGAVRKVEAYCDARVPKGVRDQVRLEAGVRGNAVTIVERRPPWREGIGPEWTTLKIAQLRYDAATGMWTLYWADRNGRWLRYPDAEPASSIETLIAAIEGDRSGAFFG